MKHRTAQGKVLDMAALIAKNEKTRAVGNMKVNARGDTVDSHGRIVEPVTNKVANAYAKTVGNKGANVVKKTAVPKEQLTKDELELEDNLEDELAIEQIKQNSKKV